MYKIMLDNPEPLFLIFTLLSVVQAWRGFQLTGTIRKKWQTLLNEPLTHHKKSIADQASFYISVPIGVAVHELGHAIVVWLFGGRLYDWGYFFFWGYVVPDRMFSNTIEWWISFAGTLGNLLFGLAVWLWSRNHASSAMRYFGLRTLRFQIFFALIYYPVFTAFLQVGDWRTILNFDKTPFWSGGWAVCHVAILLGYLGLQGRGFFEMPATGTTEAQTRLAELQQAVDGGYADDVTKTNFVQSLIRGDAPKTASRYLKQFASDNPNNAVSQYQLGLLEKGNGSEVSGKSADYFRSALSLGLETPSQIWEANYYLGSFYSERSKMEEALSHFDAAQTQSDKFPLSPVYAADLLWERGKIHRNLGRLESAVSDIEQAIEIAETSSLKNTVAEYKQLLAVVRKEVGSSSQIS